MKGTVYLITNLYITYEIIISGLIFGAIFMENPNAASFSAGIVILPLFIFAGFFKKISLMPTYLIPLSYASFLRYALSAILIAVFGIGRCPYEHGLIEAELDVSNLTRPEWLKSMSVIFEYQALMGGSGANQIDTNKDPEENLMIMFGGTETIGNNSDKSLLLAQFEILDNNESLWHELHLLIAFVSIMHTLIYFTLVWKVGRKS